MDEGYWQLFMATGLPQAYLAARGQSRQEQEQRQGEEPPPPPPPPAVT